MATTVSVAEAHEGGHVLAALLMGFPVHEAVVDREAQVGFVRWGAAGDQCTDKGRCVVAGGAAAEIAMFGDIVSPVDALWPDICDGGWKRWADFERSAQRVAILFTPWELERAIKQVKVVSGLDLPPM